MYLKTLKLHNFKNYSEANIELCPNVNCFVGKNGVGKTNLLDAVHYLSYTKSYFGNTDKPNIKNGEEFFAIHGLFDKDEEESLISCIQKREQKKQIKFNKKEYEKLSEHIGKYPLVMISPFDQNLIYEGSEARRKFLDSIISQYNKEYLDDCIAYQRILMQRNALLKQKVAEPSLWEIIDQQLIEKARRIHFVRSDFILRFQTFFQNYYSQLGESTENVDISYLSQLNEETEKDAYELKKRFPKDSLLEYTSWGCHKDDLVFSLEKNRLKIFGSQGQQKSFILSLRLAQVKFIADVKGFFPILLLDDIFDKLDPERVKKLIHLVGQEHFGQVLISDTDRKRVESFLAQSDFEHRIFEIENKQIIPR